MELFTLGCDYTQTETTGSIIDTPLGPSYTFHLETGARLTTFYSRDFEAELLICRPNYLRHPEQQIIDCWSFLWRFRASQFIQKPIFMVTWKKNYKWKEYGYNGGQYLESLSFSNNHYVVSIGTQDDEMLKYRALRNDYIPKKFVDMLIKEPSGSVSGFNEGIEVLMPDLEPTDDICQIHFVVAWNTEFKDEVATWYAVDCLPEYILENAGVK